MNYILSGYTWIYNLIFVQQITHFLSEGTMILSKTIFAVAAQNRRKVMVMLDIIKQCKGSFHLFKCLPKTANQYSWVLLQIFCLKFENSLFGCCLYNVILT